MEFGEIDGDWDKGFKVWDIPLAELKTWLTDYARKYPDNNFGHEDNVSHWCDYRMQITEKGRIIGEKYVEEGSDEGYW